MLSVIKTKPTLVHVRMIEQTCYVYFPRGQSVETCTFQGSVFFRRASGRQLDMLFRGPGGCNLVFFLQTLRVLIRHKFPLDGNVFHLHFYLFMRVKGVPEAGDGGGSRREKGVSGAAVAAHGNVASATGVLKHIGRANRCCCFFAGENQLPLGVF